MGILCCGGLMIYSMVIAKGASSILSTQLFILWIIMGSLIYATYGYRKNRLAEIDIVEENKIEKDEIKTSI